MSNFNVDFCCVCLKIYKERDKLVSLNFVASKDITYGNKLKCCVPEMVLQDTEGCFLCNSCSEALENAYNFRCMCLITGNRLREYRDQQQRNSNDVCSIRDDLLQILSKDLEDENPAVTAAKELGNLLTETIGKQESNSALHTVRTVRTSKRKLSDDDLIRKACKIIPELWNTPVAAFKCQVSLEKIVVKDRSVLIPNDEKKKHKFYCKECDRIIKRKERFYSHVLKHSNIKGYKCEDCDAAYFSADSLRNHKKRMHSAFALNHNDTKKPSINLSSTKSVTRKAPEKKNIEVKKNKSAPQERCILKIKLPTKINNSQSSTTILNGRVFRCNYCDYRTTLKNQYDRHAAKHTENESFPCHRCSMVYLTQQELTNHVCNVQNGDESTLTTKRRKTKMLPPIQIKEEIVDEEDQVVCTVCSASFNSEAKYKLHLQTHVQSNENSKSKKKKKKKFFCTVCNLKFSTKDHANIHTGEKPYTCQICLKSFGAYSTMRKHRYTHRTTDELMTKSVCEICKQEFGNEVDLRSHNCQTASGQSVYTCQICRNAYLGRTALIDHMKIHVEQNEK